MAGAIAQAVEYIKESLPLRTLDESATKQGVVLRLLSLAGWNPYDVLEVVPEHSVGSRRVDYALRPSSPNAVFIEVKRPSENLDGHQQQLLEYCFQQGVKLAVLTNGRIWWLYLPLQAGSWVQRRFLTIDLESQEPPIVEQRFIEYLSEEKVSSGRAVRDAEELVQSQHRAEITRKTIVEAWNQIVDTPDEILVKLIAEATERICGFKPESSQVEEFLVQRSTRVTTPIPPDTPESPPPAPPAPRYRQANTIISSATGRTSVIDGKGTRPSSFTFLSTERFPKTWIGVLIELCVLISQQHPEEFDRVLDLPRGTGRGRWRHHFSRTASDLRVPKLIPSVDILVEGDIPATKIIDTCYRVIELFGYSPDSFVFKTE